MIKTIARVRAVAPDLVRDGAGIGGAVLVSLGAAEIYRPAGFIVGGAFLLVGAFLSARKAG